MMNHRWRTFPRRSALAIVSVAGALAALALVPMASSAEPDLGRLNSELGQQQARSQQLESSLSGLSSMIGSLSGQIALVESREAAVQAELAHDRIRLAADQAALVREQRLLARLRARLALGRMLLARQLVSNYESDSPDLMSVLLESSGFKDLLERITFLHDAEHQQQAIITFTRVARAKATVTARRLATIEAAARRVAEEAAVRVRALAGMNSLLHAKQSALEQARSVQRAALAASRARSGKLQAKISQIEAEQSSLASSGSVSAPAGGSGGWVIPSSIVQCESGGQDLPPNSAGASGYYQIIPSTWKLYGGTGPSAYVASRAEQSLVASRIWAGGSGASNWVCAGMVGIH